ncbi:glutathione S-transferase family protein [Myxacorys almedinensis]|uniref:Glutathione S-transferase family protein n=1 Tax=Myxacorys almedinensis A TaxID=2690445 RepID=A0A8J8CH37_9CYAN|nr:glutathione S-transferase C-terminal domain-containing protein [Myxacorys almedinensis]NDJ16249.1 glutathione S-transferase family protein [Myxacorys almedinensis A]
MAKLPPKLVIQSGKFVWTTLWHVMMSNLAPRSPSGEYTRPASEFRNTISPDPDALYPPASGRYKLFVGMSCPWAHRTLVVRSLKGLEAAIAVSLVSPSPVEGGWILDTPEYGCRTLAEIYHLAKSDYKGRCTVPVLWDTKTNSIVNNESAEIIVMLNGNFTDFSTHPELDLYPESLREKIEIWNDKIYHAVNNGVYRCGFAQTQEAYEIACRELFATLDEIDRVLGTQPYLCGETLTLADIRLFTTLFRFDVAYFGLFKCSLRRIEDYSNLGSYLRHLYHLPGVENTCDLEAVKRDYYGNLFPLNPGGIIPLSADAQTLLKPRR